MRHYFFNILWILSTYNAVCQYVSAYTQRASKISKSISYKEAVVESAKLFLGTAYVPGTLDHDSTEQLVVNLKGMDCITMIEYALALKDAIDEKTFNEKLISLRYRSGNLSGYASRVHYLSEWIQQLLTLTPYSEIIGDGQNCFEPQFGYMSAHPDSYRNLKGQPQNVILIKKIEELLNDKMLGYPFFTRESFRKAELRHGDLVAFKSKIKGLDFDHVGIVVLENGKSRLLHASFDKKKVLITEESVFDYFDRIRKFDGVTVIR